MNNRTHRALQALLLIAVAATLSACSMGSQSMARNDWMNEDGLPHDRYRVGGGFQASFTAPVDGVAYVAETVQGRLIVTEGLEQGNDFELSGGIDPKQFEEAVGVKPSEAQFTLYFVPLQDMGYGSVKQAQQNAPQADAAQQ